MVTHFTEQDFVAPGCLGDQMVQGLTRRLDVPRIHAGRHRLNALAFTGQEQSLAVVLQRYVSIFVPATFARPSIYAAKRFSCGPGAERRDLTKQFYIKMFFCDPVVLARRRTGFRAAGSGSYWHPLWFIARPACPVI